MIERNDNEPEEEFQARLLRVETLTKQIISVVDGASEDDALQALSIVTVRECLAGENPDRTFLQCLDGALAVFRDMSNKMYRGQDKAVS